MLFKKQRSDLLYYCKKIYSKQLIIGTWGNFSLRVSQNTYLITPSGMSYSSLKCADLCIVAIDETQDNIFGKLKRNINKRKPSSEYNLHSVIYKNRLDVNAIIHTHADYSKAFAIARLSIVAASEDLAQAVGGDVDVADYAFPGTNELAENTVKALRGKKAVLMANHGLVAVGANLAETLNVAEVVEKNAYTTIMASILGKPHRLDDKDILLMHDFYLTKYGQK